MARQDSGRLATGTGTIHRSDDLNPDTDLAHLPGAGGGIDVTHLWDSTATGKTDQHGTDAACTGFVAAPPDSPGGRLMGGFNESGAYEQVHMRLSDGSDVRIS